MRSRRKRWNSCWCEVGSARCAVSARVQRAEGMIERANQIYVAPLNAAQTAQCTPPTRW